MEKSVGISAGHRVVSAARVGGAGGLSASASGRNPETLRLQLLGPLMVQRGTALVLLPSSRKVRALIAYLALAPRAVPRERLCQLLWDAPNDPRGELRWCLSKARAALDGPAQPRIVSGHDGVHLDLQDAWLDVAELDAAVQAGPAALDTPALRQLCALFGGDFLEGLSIERSAPFSAWLLGQRRRLRMIHSAILDQLTLTLPPASDETVELLARWLQVAPLEARAHARMLDALAQRGQLREGQEHAEAAMRLFKAEGRDAAAIGQAWRHVKDRGASPAVVVLAAPVPLGEPVVPAAVQAGRRASIVVMPFSENAPGRGARAGLGTRLAHDITMRLARLRTVFVISEASAATLAARGLNAMEAARALNVDYVAGGCLQRDGHQLLIDVQLTEARTERIVWAEVLSRPLADTLAVLAALGDQLVGAIAAQVELAERNRAVLKLPSQLDAWESHHRGLWHMYRFNRDDNAQACGFFEAAIRVDPTFSRPHAGLSFTHFQNAFLGWGDRAVETELAYRTASDGALADDQDPVIRWALGRAHWLRGDVEAALSELDAALALSPNFSQGHYTRAFVLSQSGDAEAAIESTDQARELSPFDPLLFAMLATRAMALMRLGRHDEAATWALKAIARPNAHVHILAIAACCLALAGRQGEAQRVRRAIDDRVPGYAIGDFLAAFRFDPQGAALIQRVMPRLALID